jgi:hypothetical protein
MQARTTFRQTRPMLGGMPRPLQVSATRTYPLPVEETFDRVLTAPLEQIFTRRYGPIAPIKSTRDQTGEPWGEVGQSRRIVMADRTSFHEELTSVDRPCSFGYRLTGFVGPLKAIAASVDGRWGFERAGTGTRVTWDWSVHPQGRLGEVAMPAFGRLWQGTARQVLEELERFLLR